MNIQIFNTGYHWNVLSSINSLIDGFLWGIGFVMALLIFSMYVKCVTKENVKK